MGLGAGRRVEDCSLDAESAPLAKDEGRLIE